MERRIPASAGRSAAAATLLILLLTLPGCAAAPRPSVLPTAAARALVPTAAAARPLPPTSTAIPTPTSTPAATPTPECGPGRVVAATLPSVVAGEVVNYRIYLPPCYGTLDRRYPTLYLLHGNEQDERFWDELGVDEAAEAAIRNGTLPPLLIVMPDGGELAYNTSGGPGSFEALVVDELLPHVEATTCAWGAPAGRAIGGLSRGGYWALEIAFRHPEQFASVGGHSAALLDIGAGPDLDPLYTGVVNPLGDLRIYLDIGSEDWVRGSIEPLHEALFAAAVPHQWLLQPGDHNEAYWSSHLSDYLLWYGAAWAPDPQAYPPCSAADP